VGFELSKLLGYEADCLLPNFLVIAHSLQTFYAALLVIKPKSSHLVKSKLVLGSIVQLRSARALVTRNLLGCLKRSLVFTSYPDCSE
jgi:hypothetical protein